MPWTEFATTDDFFDFTDERRVSKWPRSGTPRIDCDFRMSLGEGLPFPRPDRFIGLMVTVPQTPNGSAYPIIDMESSGDFTLHGTSGPNTDGRTVDLDIVQHLAADFPGSDFPGIEYHFIFKKEGRDDFNWTWYYESVFPIGTNRPIPMDANNETPSGGVIETHDNPALLDVDWPPLGFDNHWQWFPMSLCFDWPPNPPFPGMAEMNGVDSYIALTNNLTNFFQPFKLSAEVRLHNVTTFWPILGREANGGFFGMHNNEVLFGNVRYSTSWTPFLDRWFTWVYEFEPLTQLQHKLTIDGIVVSDITTNRQFVPFNNLGVYKHNLPGTIWANLDLRRLKYEKGTPGSYTTVLDMPLELNALDAGPNANHGTTFNMTLPSV